MKRSLNRLEAQKRIDGFFQKTSFSAREMRKIKRLAMKYKIRLNEYRGFFCKKCFLQLKGKIRIKKGWKIVECRSCGFKNKSRIDRDTR